MSETNLLLCPFCGIKLQCKGGDFYFHGKADCILSEFEFDGLSEKDWNARTQTDPVKSTDALMTLSCNIVCKILEAQHAPVMTKGELAEYVFSQIRDFIKQPDLKSKCCNAPLNPVAFGYFCSKCGLNCLTVQPNVGSEPEDDCLDCGRTKANEKSRAMDKWCDVCRRGLIIVGKPTPNDSVERMRGALELIPKIIDSSKHIDPLTDIYNVAKNALKSSIALDSDKK